MPDDIGERLDRSLEEAETETCTRCRGVGEVPCSRCRGLGYTECIDKMDGLYHETCAECGGCREVVCPACGGTD